MNWRIKILLIFILNTTSPVQIISLSYSSEGVFTPVDRLLCTETGITIIIMFGAVV